MDYDLARDDVGFAKGITLVFTRDHINSRASKNDAELKLVGLADGVS